MSNKDFEYEPRRKSGGKGGLIAALVILSVIVVLLLALVFLMSNRSRGDFGSREEPLEAVGDRIEQWAEGVENAVEKAVEKGVAGYDYHYANADSFTVGNAEVEPGTVNRLVIDWVAGQVTVEPYDGDTISVSEPLQAKEKNKLRWRQEGDTLTIRYCASTGSGDAASKDLTVKVPVELAAALRYVQISAASADAYVSGLEVGELQFDSTSGGLYAEGDFDILDLDTVSGDLEFYGTAKDAEIDTVSGNVIVVCAVTPNELSFDSASGNLNLLLPESRSFEADFGTVSGEFQSELPLSRSENWFYLGTQWKDQPAELEFDTVSGNVQIKKMS